MRINWFDAIAFRNAKSRAEGLQPAYIIDGNGIHWDRRANGYRLPTEAEWEYAASQSTPAGRADWSADNSGASTHPVGVSVPDALGIYDLHGNVDEWCWDTPDLWWGYLLAVDPARTKRPDRGEQALRTTATAGLVRRLSI